MRKLLVVVAAVALAAGLTGCEWNRDTAYQRCMETGGQWSEDTLDWSCSR